MAEPALAWDITSHRAISNAAVDYLVGQGVIARDAGDKIAWYSWGDEGEAIHKFYMTDDGLTVGSNGGNNYPDNLWKLVVEDYRKWQNTGDNTYRMAAYQHLGQLVHAVEDQGAPPHALYVPHGDLIKTGEKFDNFEVMAFSYTYVPWFVIDSREKPSFEHPWEYYNWLKDWTQDNTADAFGQQYWHLGGYGSTGYGYAGGIYGSDAEVALLQEQWGASEQVIRWLIRDAQQKLDDPTYTVEESGGDRIHVVIYEDIRYNYLDTEYLRSQSIVYEPDLSATGRMTDPNFVYQRNGGWASIESSDLGFMAYLISSIDIEGPETLKVTLYSGPGFTGESRVLTPGDYTDDFVNPRINFNDRAASMKIEWDPYAPSSGTYSLSGPISADGWYNSDMVTLSGASDDGSGIDKVVYKLDADTTWTEYTAPFHVEDGGHALLFKAVDKAGNEGPIVFDVINVDTIAPSSSGTCSLSGSLSEYGWYNSDMVTLSGASDDRSGIARVVYRLDDYDAWIDYTEPFHLQDGEHTLYFKAFDLAGNEGPLVTATIKVDTLGPEASHYLPVNGPGWANVDRVGLNASDSVSGVAKIVYRLDGETAWEDYAGRFHVEDGEHTLYVQGIDKAGNTGPLATAALKVDTVAPRTRVILPINIYGWVTPDPVVLEVSDLSGAALTTYKPDDGGWLNYTAPFAISKGYHSIRYRSVDNAGNVEAENSLSFELVPMPHLDADFTASPDSGTAPLTVQFTDASTGGAKPWWSWFWVFGDNSTSDLQNPSHQYATAGTYTAMLVVTSEDGRYNLKKKTITVSDAAPSATVTPSPLPGGDESRVTITPKPATAPSPTQASEQTGPGAWWLLLLALLAGVAGIAVFYYGFWKK